jgi:hypothetical protein
MIMEQLTPIGSKIAAAFVKAQKAFGPALKSSTNPHFRSKYADLSACVEAVIDALNANGIALIQRTYDDKDGITVETVFVHESGEVLEGGMLHFPAIKTDPHGLMGLLTYARRGSLMAACGLAPEDDDGNTASRKTSNVNPSIMADHLLAIEESGSSEELTKAYNDAYAACDGDATWQAKVIAAKKARVERAKKEKANDQ